jgi:diacylglycerol kinase family enzyme
VIAHARAAVDKGASLVVAGGGDGTLNAVASVLVGTDVTMGVIPMGTLNHFAKDMSIPLELDRAIDAIIARSSARIDVGEVNGRIFLNNASLGLYPRIVRERESLQRAGWGKWLAFLRASLSTIRHYSPLRVRLQSVRLGETVEAVPFVFVGNNEYQVEGPDLGQRKRLDAGRLWVYRSAQTSRLQLLGLFFGQVVGASHGRQLKVFDTAELQVDMAEGQPEVGLDGEVVRLAAPLTFRILPAALQVIVPAPGP